jgi:hypothetical protein
LLGSVVEQNEAGPVCVCANLDADGSGLIEHSQDDLTTLFDGHATAMFWPNNTMRWALAGFGAHPPHTVPLACVQRSYRRGAFRRTIGENPSIADAPER